MLGLPGWAGGGCREAQRSGGNEELLDQQGRTGSWGVRRGCVERRGCSPSACQCLLGGCHCSLCWA